MAKSKTRRAKPVPAGEEAVSTLASRIYGRLAEDIIRGTLTPGQRLEELTLAAQFGVSRTPIREALRELHARKLITLVPRRGGVVASLGVDALIDMLDAECEIEGLCARLASQRMTTLDRGQLHDAHERAHTVIEAGDLDAYFVLNKEFHDVICSGAHNATLDNVARDLRFRLSPFRRSPPDSDRKAVMARSHEDHSAIVAAISDGNPERAYEAMRAHNARVNSVILRMLRQSAAA